ncbi:branched-chain amino acid ABC transporter permease [Phreatobacter stygius]|uniref:Branched-chain amino acid ABC transporter permease n=1 Tax=Phreatobacter stygius TaxID=1940610 RepID=A0A4D7BFD0_9HYPH|nr:branched-chain amino acid ABC transporter permease [Phreatobacter stygius]QCI66587.1 branched-chain amino acid ABC transporter permease [Phreatobacter stygius]
MILFFEQTLNGLQLGVMLFLLAAGLTLVFGIMGIINLAHGSLYMIGAMASAVIAMRTGSFGLGLLAGLGAAGLGGMAIELGVLRQLYARPHLDQVGATFGLILLVDGLATMIVGRQPLFVAAPQALSGAVTLWPGLDYPVYRLVVIGVGLLVAVLLYLIVHQTRLGMLIRAGATHRETVRALGVDIRLVYTLVFGLGALLAGLAGVIAGPLVAVQVGMGEQILIGTFVVVVIGGTGSIRGAFLGAMLVGLVDTLTRAFAPGLLKQVLPASEADALAGGLSSIAVYLLMAMVLLVRPEGLLPAQGQTQ